MKAIFMRKKRAMRQLKNTSEMFELFARMFYSVDHDIVRLADVLGHSSVNTTRFL